MNPQVSIIVPVHNAQATLRRCVNSILHQEFTDLELLLIDDGSTDDSGALCDEFAAQDERILVIHKENSGVSDARNLGLSRARGTYLQFVDSDDWISPDATKRFVKAAQENGCDLVIADFYRGGAAVAQRKHRRDGSFFQGKICGVYDGKSGGFLLRRSVEQAVSQGYR